MMQEQGGPCVWTRYVRKEEADAYHWQAACVKQHSACESLYTLLIVQEHMQRHIHASQSGHLLGQDQLDAMQIE